MAVREQPSFDMPIAGQSLTAELGGRPWQQPPQYATVEEALDYYIPSLESEEVSTQLLDVLEMGIPVTSVANAMQTASVMDGKHSVDVGVLVLPVLIELIMLIAETAGVEYISGLEPDKTIMNKSLINKAIRKYEKEKEKEDEPLEDTGVMTTIESLQEETPEEKTGGLMSRSK
jgi:hypothetical protein